MDPVIPRPLQKVIDSLATLPGVGPRTAERFAYWFLKNEPARSQALASVLQELHGQISYCPKTFALIEKGQKVSPLYSNPKRNKKVVAVVADPFDIVALEKTQGYSGTYHVLGGLLSPIDGIGPEQLHVKELVRRVVEDQVKEVILATSASVEGESTSLLIVQQLSRQPVKITRLARGLPIGLDLEYADQITLSRALEGRQAVQK